MKAFWHAGVNSPDTGSVRYNWLAADREATWCPNERTSGGRSVPLTDDVTITKVTVWLTTAPGSGKRWAFTVRDDAADTSAAVTISNTATTAQWTGSVNIAAGSMVCMKSTPTSTPAGTGNMWWVVEYQTAGDFFLMIGGTALTANGNVTWYMPPSGCTERSPSSTATDFYAVSPIAMNVTKIGLATTYAGAPGGNNYVASMRKNNTTDSATVTLTGGGTSVVGSITSFAVAAGDRINTKIVPSGGAAWTSYAFCYTCYPANLGDVPMMYATYRVPSTSTTTYEGPQAFGQDADWGTNEANVQYRMPAGTLTRLYFQLDIAPGGVAARTFTARLNGVNQSLVAAISGSGTASSDTSHSAAVSEGDRVSFQCFPANSPANSRVAVSLVVNTLQVVTSTMAMTMVKATASLTGKETVSGTVGATMKQLTAALTGSETVSGSLGATLQKALASLTGAEQITGTIAATMQKLSTQLSGKEDVVGTLGATMKPATFFSVGTQTLAATLQKLLFTASGSETAQGSITARLRAPTADLTMVINVLPTPETVPAIRFAIARGLPIPFIVSPTQLVTLRTKSGVQLDQWLPQHQISLTWTREKRETSRCELTLVSDMTVTNSIPNIVPLVHWVDVWDDTGNDLLWTGQISTFDGGREDIKIVAHDISSLGKATRNPLTKRWEATDPAVVADEFYQKLIQHHDLAAKTIVRPDPLGDRYDFSSTKDSGMIDKIMDDLVNMGLTWTIVNGTVILGPLPRKPFVALGEEHFVGADIRIKRDGTESYNDILLRSATNLAYAKAPMGGLSMQKIVTVDDMFGVSNTDKATKEYAKYASRIRDMITIPGGSVLRNDAPVSIEQLIPTARVTMEAYNELFLMELTSVEVTSTSGTSSVAVTLEAVDDDLPELVQLQSKQSISGLNR